MGWCEIEFVSSDGRRTVEKIDGGDPLADSAPQTPEARSIQNAEDPARPHGKPDFSE